MASEAPRAITLVYRGQLDIERSRIEFIVGALCREFDAVDVVHLSPGIGSDEARLHEFLARFPEVRRVSFLPATSRQVLAGRRQLSALVNDDASHVVAVGFSAWPYLVGLHVAAWFINGIPEERLLSSNSLAARTLVRATWWGARAVRSELIVVVSTDMARVVTSRHMRAGRVEVVPNAVDLGTYSTSATGDPVYLTYQGGGSPWQGLARLAHLWSAMYALDDRLRFRVISRDPRTAVLASGLPGDAVEFVSATDAGGVADLLSQARLGFLYRAPSLVNSVSWPMKFGEYLAAGTPVVVTDCGWDIAPLVDRYDAGLVVRWDDPPDHTARTIVDYLDHIGEDRPAGVAGAAASLSTTRWEPVVRDSIRSAVTSAPRGAHA